MIFHNLNSIDLNGSDYLEAVTFSPETLGTVDQLVLEADQLSDKYSRNFDAISQHYSREESKLKVALMQPRVSAKNPALANKNSAYPLSKEYAYDDAVGLSRDRVHPLLKNSSGDLPYATANRSGHFERPTYLSSSADLLCSQYRNTRDTYSPGSTSAFSETGVTQHTLDRALLHRDNNNSSSTSSSSSSSTAMIGGVYDYVSTARRRFAEKTRAAEAQVAAARAASTLSSSANVLTHSLAMSPGADHALRAINPTSNARPQGSAVEAPLFTSEASPLAAIVSRETLAHSQPITTTAPTTTSTPRYPRSESTTYLEPETVKLTPTSSSHHHHHHQHQHHHHNKNHQHRHHRDDHLPASTETNNNNNTSNTKGALPSKSSNQPNRKHVGQELTPSKNNINNNSTSKMPTSGTNFDTGEDCNPLDSLIASVVHRHKEDTDRNAEYRRL